jgi:hypothetical protein
MPVKFFSITVPFMSWLPAYGWKRVRTLAETGEDVVGMANWNLGAPDHNADSLALFGSAARLLDHERPRRVLDNGRIEPIGG